MILNQKIKELKTEHKILIKNKQQEVVLKSPTKVHQQEGLDIHICQKSLLF